AGLKEVEIPIGARIVSVIDAFDAMVSSRPYRQGMSPEEAIRRLVLSSETQFDLPWFSASFTSPRRRCRRLSPPRALPSLPLCRFRSSGFEKSHHSRGNGACSKRAGPPMRPQTYSSGSCMYALNVDGLALFVESSAHLHLLPGKLFGFLLIVELI